MYQDNYTSEHVYSVYEVTQIIGKTPAQVLRLIKKGYLQANRTSSDNYVITDKQLGDYYLFGQFGRRPSKKSKTRKF